jgi:hypothetical protein
MYTTLAVSSCNASAFYADGNKTFARSSTILVEVFRGFTESLQMNGRLYTLNKPQPLLIIFF